jgi:hypothetical protein
LGDSFFVFASGFVEPLANTDPALAAVNFIPSANIRLRKLSIFADTGPDVATDFQVYRSGSPILSPALTLGAGSSAVYVETTLNISVVAGAQLAITWEQPSGSRAASKVTALLYFSLD